MKIILGIFSGNDKVLGIKESLEKMGHEVMPVYTDDYRMICPYYKKKLDKMGFHLFRMKYEEMWKQHLHGLLDEFHPDVVLFINFPEYIFDIRDLQDIKKQSKIICWFVDGVSEKKELIKYYPYFDRICVFEERDVMFLHDVCNISSLYVPVGYNAAYENCKPEKKEFDIIFIGSPLINRLKILESVAKKAEEEKWKLTIYGPFYDERYPWKKYFFRVKYPHIVKYLKNTRVMASQVAKLYSKTKICLNIHTPEHKSPNPRTFDILATGSFELIDERKSYGGFLEEDRDLVQFKDIDDLLDKIDYYLRYEAEREKIAENGHRAVSGILDMKSLLTTVLG